MALRDVILGYAKGAKGEKGDTGPKGDAGSIGPKGDPGNIADAEIIDTYGLVATEGQKTTAQAILDAIANKIVNVLVTNENLTQKLADYMLKSLMSNVQLNSTGNVPTSALVYSMQQALDQVNSRMGKGEFLSTSILDKALSITAQGAYTYCLGGASYSGNDLPHNSHAYGSASIYWRNSASIAVVLFGASKNSPLSINLYNGSAWNGWETYVRNSDLKLSNIKTLVTSKVDISGNTTWNETITGTFPMDYKKYVICCRVRGALGQCMIIDNDLLSLFNTDGYLKVSDYWNSDNSGSLSVYNGNYRVESKTNSLEFTYNIFGLN